MQTSDQIQISFLGISIVNVDLKVSQSHDGDQKVDLKVDAKLLPREPNSDEFRIWMAVDLIAQEYWEVKIAGFGVFKFGSGVPETEQTKLINVNAPAIMFPYFRSFISTLTANCGGAMPMVIMPPQFFRGPLEELVVSE